MNDCIATYQEPTFQGTECKFVLYPDRLVLLVEKESVEEYEQTVELHLLSPYFDRGRVWHKQRRLLGNFRTTIVFVFGAFFFLQGLLGLPAIPRGAKRDWNSIPWASFLLGAGLVSLGVYCLIPRAQIIDWAAFKSSTGQRMAFVRRTETMPAEQFEAFLLKLGEQIRLVRKHAAEASGSGTEGKASENAIREL